MINFMNKFFLKRKKIIFNELIYELTKIDNNKRRNIYKKYNELFNEYKKKEKILNELEYKFNKSEEKLCTFSPKINHGNNKFKKKILKKEINNKSYEININRPFYGILYGINNNDLKTYETIDNNNIIINFLDKSRIKNISKNNLYNIKYLNEQNNYFLSNTSRNSENIKYNTIENSQYNKNHFKRNNSFRNKNTLKYNNILFKEITGDKNQNIKKNKENYLNKKGKNNINNNKVLNDYVEPLLKNIYENKYNTIDISEKKDINIFNNKNLFKETATETIKKEPKSYKGLKISKSNKTCKISNSVKKDNKQNEESKPKEYYYSFRKEKLPYNNSFNYSSKNKYKNLIRNKDSKINKKSKKNKIPISLRDNSKFRNSNIINKIYSNNYKSQINRIQKSEQDFNTNNNSFNNRNYKISKNKLFILDLTSKKESTRQQSNTNLNTNNDSKGNNISSFSLNNLLNIKPKKEIYLTNIKRKKELSYRSSANKMEENKQYEIVNECNMNLEKRKEYKNIKSEKSMTLQSLSDSKMLELAEHYINNGEDSFEDLDWKYLEFKKNIKKEKESRDITFG